MVKKIYQVNKRIAISYSWVDISIGDLLLINGNDSSGDLEKIFQTTHNKWTNMQIHDVQIRQNTNSVWMPFSYWVTTGYLTDITVQYERDNKLNVLGL